MSIDRFDPSRPPRVLILTSPKAGSGAGREEIPRLVNLLAETHITCQVIQSIEEFGDQLAKGHDGNDTVVVAAGGDGTLGLATSIVSAHWPSTEDYPLLVPMPMGTENLVARQYGFTRSAEDVVRTIRHGTVHTIDSGLANEKRFLIMATSGFDAEVVRRLHLARSGHIWRVSYLGPILQAIRAYSFPSIRMQIDDGEPIQCAWAMVFNMPQYGGGLRIEPEACDDDGWFDVIAFRRGSVPSGLRYATEIFLGRHLKNTSVFRARGKRVTMEADTNVPYQLDGDYAGELRLQIEMQPKSVRLLMPMVERRL